MEGVAQKLFACVQTVMEACMLLCEAAIFTCSTLMVVWNMASDEGMEGYQDMEVYTVLCSISTFFALAVTLSLLLVPTHVRSCTPVMMPLMATKSQIWCFAVENPCSVSSFNWSLTIRGMHEQVWHELDEHGIGKVFAAVVVKISGHTQMWTLRTRANQVASVNMTTLQGPAQSGGKPQPASHGDDWKVDLGSNCARPSDEQLAHAATAPESSVG
jgi:hypothetical protein